MSAVARASASTGVSATSARSAAAPLSFCEHGRRRSYCKECGGSQICEHGRQRSSCKECGGNAICEHGQRRSTCEECEDELPGKRDIDSIYAAALRKLARDQKREKRERDQ